MRPSFPAARNSRNTALVCLAASLAAAGCGDAGTTGGGTDPGSNFEIGVQGPSGGPAPGWPVPYPPAPYGFGVGSVVPNMTFLGLRNPKSAGYDASNLETITLADYYDPDGLKGLRLLHFDIVATWCGFNAAEHYGPTENTTSPEGCVAPGARMGSTARGMRVTLAPGCYDIHQDCSTVCYAKTLAEEVGSRQPRGYRFFEVLSQNIDSYPAGAADLATWSSTFAIEWPVLLDGNDKLSVVRDVQGTFPNYFLIDPRTMSIVAKIANDATPGPLWAAVDAELAKP